MNILLSAGNTLMFAGAFLAFTWLFAFIYIKVTPYDELALIRNDNLAAALAFGGAILGFVFNLAGIVKQSHSILDMAIWAPIALFIQLIIWWVIHWAIGDLEKLMREDHTAAGAFLGACSLATGVGVAACMTA
jgi:putative membrane protein